eukprot:TRINITY_DN1506_c0_g1_i1.p1 TRINITY_DN1506_c0_g1~~TRINITY_DN1506_c0_g1_i1.p1  ORF type:complete len:773 (-),score=230.44 TRINITY_DN1506_c0_g1_i1:109-2148(-)
MRRDLLHWDQALALAKTLAPAMIPLLSTECASQIEFKGEYQQALEMYTTGQAGLTEQSEYYIKCKAGIARMNIRLGDISTGIKLAAQLQNNQVLRECAQILESMKQLPEAAQLYAQGSLFDKSASIYLKCRNYGQLKDIMPNVTSPGLHSLYAKAKEEQGDLAEAERSYILANDFDNVIRLNLKFTAKPERAIEFARKTGSQIGAKMVAEFCQNTGDFRSAIEFLFRAKLDDDAFNLAQQQNAMDKYAEVLGTDGTLQQYDRIATFYETHGDFLEAGKFFAKCQQYPKALKLFLRCGERAISPAIDVVGKARDVGLTKMLLDYLMGDTDGVTKNPLYIFRLHMALGDYLLAARTAIVIARQEQALGHYAIAHSTLFDAFEILDTNNIPVIPELRRSLCLLHSYILAKLLISKKFHEAAARMLIRVARNINKFQNHLVPILISTVLECQIGGLNKSAFEFATVLVSPEYRRDIPQQYKLKIEGVVRKMDKTEDVEKTTPCPNCSQHLFRTELDCPNCKSFLPWCIITGRHMVLDDWTCCPLCKFPALYKHFMKHISSGQHCPMCDRAVDPATVVKETNPTPILKKMIESIDIAALQAKDDQPPKTITVPDAKPEMRERSARRAVAAIPEGEVKKDKSGKEKDKDQEAGQESSKSPPREAEAPPQESARRRHHKSPDAGKN